MIILWGALGTLCGSALGILTRKLLRTGAFSPAAWTTSAVMTGIAFAALAWRLGPHFALLPYSYLAAVLVPLAVVDLTERRLPSTVVLPSYLALGAAFGMHAVLTTDFTGVLRSLAGMASLATAYLALALATGGLGAGDVKLAGLLGLALAWWSWTALLAGTFLGWLLAALVLGVLRGAGRVDRDDPMPLGPYLALGAVATIALDL